MMLTVPDSDYHPVNCVQHVFNITEISKSEPMKIICSLNKSNAKDDY